MKRLFKFKYPKMIGLVIAVILAYFIFTNSIVEKFVSNLGLMGYIGIFLAGIFFGIGFTAPFAAGFFITLNPQNIWLAAIVGGLGSLIANIAIFKVIETSFKKEFKQLKKTKAIEEIDKIITNNLGKKIKLYLLYIFIGIVIALPLPDEIAILMLAGFTHIRMFFLAKMSFILHVIGILIFLYI